MMAPQYDNLIEKLCGTSSQCYFFCRLWGGVGILLILADQDSDLDSTLYLFELEYQVPLLPWELAAHMGQ